MKTLIRFTAIVSGNFASGAGLAAEIIRWADVRIRQGAGRGLRRIELRPGSVDTVSSDSRLLLEVDGADAQGRVAADRIVERS